MMSRKMGMTVGLLGVATAFVALGLLVGGLAGASPISSGLSGALVTNTPATNTSQSFNFSADHPDWNTGNLCTPVTTGSVVTCSYSGGGHGYSYGGNGGKGGGGGCGCSPAPLTYNFSGANLQFVVNIASAGNIPVYLNFVGHNDTILVNVTGCSGTTLNISVLMQTTFTFDVSASHVTASIYLYSDSDHYVANLSGDKTKVWTYIVSAKPKYNECPAGNNTKTDSYLLNITGSYNFQGLVFVNGVGYSTSLNTVSTGSWNSVAFENTTTFGCSWSNAPAPTCHSHGMGPAAEGAAVRENE